ESGDMSLSLKYRTRRGATVVAVVSLMVSLAFGLSPGVAATSKTMVLVAQGKPSELRFELSRTSVPVGQVTFKVVNKGHVAHDFKICASPKGGSANACTGIVTKLLRPGRSATLSYAFKK